MKTLAALKQQMDVPVVIANQQGFIIYINDCFTATLGWTADEILGKLLTTILPYSFHDCHNLAFARFQATEQSNVLNHPIRLSTITKNQKAIETEHFIVAEKLEDQWFFGATLRPLNQDQMSQDQVSQDQVSQDQTISSE